MQEAFKLTLLQDQIQDLKMGRGRCLDRSKFVQSSVAVDHISVIHVNSRSQAFPYEFQIALIITIDLINDVALHYFSMIE